jgi:transmembrane sensor
MERFAKSRDSLWDQAAEWHARMRAPDCTGRDRGQFEAWLRSDPAHWRAYAEAERVTRRFDQLIEQDAELAQMADAAFEEAPVGAAPRRWAMPAALAASLIVGLLVVRFVSHLETAAPALATYVTAPDQQRNVTLPDSSVLHLDVGSEVSVRMSADLRQVSLIRGRALFDVAKDHARPFVVSAGDTRTTALGTQFQVQREGERVVVVLAEGSVSVAQATAEAAWEERLAPGDQLRRDSHRARPVRNHVDPLIATSWARGRLIFRGTPLVDALEEVNRYSSRKVRLADSSLAALPVGGNFIAGDSELIVSAFAAALPLRPVDGGGGEILLFRRYESDPP